ncbi:Zeatin O-glucosyltransferase [Euphorbia peplus]|nr:Zeatin O-glucosyltransferase [Euphorbia peplus]
MQKGMSLMGSPRLLRFSPYGKLLVKPSQSHLKVEVPEKLPSFEGCFTFEMMNFMARQNDFQKYKAGDLYNTCKLMDGTYVDLTAKSENNIYDDKQKKKKQWAIGPLQMLNISNEERMKSEDNCLKWQDKQEPNSVIYVSFGTTVVVR